MSNISDIIENFILNHFGEDDLIELSRNELANFFSCAPSQINYVLSTRFTTDKGYIIETRRGGGGGVTVMRIREGKDKLLNAIINEVESNDYFTANKALAIISRLIRDDIISEDDGNLIAACISQKALSSPFDIESKLRKQIFCEFIKEIVKR